MKKQTDIPEIRIGAGALQQLPEMLRAYGTKVLLVHGHRPVEDGLLSQVRVLLNKENFPHANMGQILPNPTYSSVKRGIKIARKEGCDIILALGGGSTLQCAKGIAAGLGMKDNWKACWKGKKKLTKVMPVASVLTDPASGSELGHKCTLVQKGHRHTLESPLLTCSFAILDPALSQYPLYPTMNQFFILYSRLFYGAMSQKGEKKDLCLKLLERLLKAADALSKDIGDLDARGELFSIGCTMHKEMKLPECPIDELATELAFEQSLPNGSGQSALFFSWLNSLDEKDHASVIEIANTLHGKQTQEFDEACKILRDSLEQTKLPLSIPECGLRVGNKALYKIARNKNEKKILKMANQSEEARLDDDAKESVLKAEPEKPEADQKDSKTK